MAISKPSWLRSMLSKLNWDILTWHVYVGDTIENGIDWAIEKINIALVWSIDALNKAVEALTRAVELGRELGLLIYSEIQKVLNRIETWWDQLGEWWEAKKWWIRELIDTATGFLQDRLKDLTKTLQRLNVAWDSFWQNTWPQLLKDFNTLLVNVGDFFTVTLPTLASRLDVTKAINDFANTWRDLFDFWGSLGREVMEFFADPLEWLWAKFTDWFLGPEE